MRNYCAVMCLFDGVRFASKDCDGGEKHADFAFPIRLPNIMVIKANGWWDGYIGLSVCLPISIVVHYNPYYISFLEQSI